MLRSQGTECSKDFFLGGGRACDKCTVFKEIRNDKQTDRIVRAIAETQRCAVGFHVGICVVP